MSRPFSLLLAAGLIPLLVGCGVPPATEPGPTVAARPTGTVVPSATPAESAPEARAADLVQFDKQGAVEFSVRPLDLDPQADTLEFEVVMDTHSVDLGWDLASLSFLLADSGVEVGATSWPVGSGHHYGGILVFPAVSADGRRVLEGATSVSLVIRDTDVPERVFAWDLN